jgi:GAF domain-containing protein
MGIGGQNKPRRNYVDDARQWFYSRPWAVPLILIASVLPVAVAIKSLFAPAIRPIAAPTELVEDYYKQLSSLSNVDAVLYRAVALLGQITSTDYNQIILESVEKGDGSGTEQTSSLVVVATDATRYSYRYVARNGLIAKSVHDFTPLNTPDVSKDSKYIGAVPRTRSELVIPIPYRQGVIGAMNSESPELDHFTAEVERHASALASALGRALVEKEWSRDTQEDQMPRVGQFAR